MSSLEQYMQYSFQLNPDESEASDHSFKFAKQIYAGGRQVFTATYDSMALSGKCTFNRFVHTKSNDEIRPLLESHRKVRINAGVLELKQSQGDGGGDRSLWPQVFPELKARVAERSKRASKKGMKCAQRTPDQYSYIADCGAANQLALSLAARLDDSDSTGTDNIYYGLDTEWNVDETRDITRVITMHFPAIIHSKTIILDLTAMGVFEEQNFPQRLKMLLSNKRLIPVAVNVSGDANRLRKLGVSIDRQVELKTLAKSLDSNNPEGYGLRVMCSRILNLHVDKTHQTSDWSTMKDRNELKEYAALDAYLHLVLYAKLKALLDKKEKSGSTSKGQRVNLMAGSRQICAQGTIQFDGSDAAGEQRHWGQLTIGKNHVLVKVDAVTMPAARPKFPYKPTPEEVAIGKKGYETTKILLKDALEITDGVIPWPSKSIEVCLASSIDNYFVRGRSTTVSTTTSTRTEAGSAAAADDENDTISPSTIPLHDQVDITESEDDDEFDIVDRDLPFTRQPLDRFHIVDALPKSKDPEMKSVLKLIRRLVVHSMVQFDPDDFKFMADYLAKKKAITAYERVLDHFYLNREYWYRRVRVYPPRAGDMLKRISKLRKFIEKEEDMRKALSLIEPFLDALEQHCEEGKLEESFDVNVYQFDGKDSNGFNLWLRNRGSNMSENLHKTMRVAFGPHSMGIQVGHFLLLLVTYRSNINAGVRRQRKHNFGMPYHHLVDRIQLRVIELFGVDIFPDHSNQSLFDPVEDHVAVGVGPLNYSSSYVDKGDPHPCLKGDLLFLASRMKLRGPPLPIVSREERRIFNEFIKNLTSKPTTKNFETLAGRYKDLADYKKVFPKLPSMLRKEYKGWEEGQSLVLLKSKLSNPLYGVLKEFHDPKGSIANCRTDAAAAFQRSSSSKTTQQDEVENLQDTRAEKQYAASDKKDAFPVPPPTAPSQVEYIASKATPVSGARRVICAAAAFGCTNFNCGRKDWWTCKLYRRIDTRNQLRVPASEEERKKQLDAFRRKRKSTLQKEHRRKKKQEQQAADHSQGD